MSSPDPGVAPRRRGGEQVRRVIGDHQDIGGARPPHLRSQPGELAPAGNVTGALRSAAGRMGPASALTTVGTAAPVTAWVRWLARASSGAVTARCPLLLCRQGGDVPQPPKGERAEISSANSTRTHRTRPTPNRSARQGRPIPRLTTSDRGSERPRLGSASGMHPLEGMSARPRWGCGFSFGPLV